MRSAAATALALLLASCSPSPWKQLSRGQTTEELLTAGVTPEQLQRPLPEAAALPQDDALPQKDLPQEDALEFRRLPNPEFILYLRPRLAGDTLVPAYQTRFSLYPSPAGWVLPGDAPRLNPAQ